MPTDTFHNLPTKKRDRILEAAITEFAAHPYDAASLSNIARQAEIAKGSLYQYFEDKKEIYRYLIELSTEERWVLMKTLPAPDPDSDLFGYLRCLFLSAVVFEFQSPGLARLTYRAFVEEVPFPQMTEELHAEAPRSSSSSFSPRAFCTAPSLRTLIRIPPPSCWKALIIRWGNTSGDG
ncbi:MAG: TetR/AcrR family transcriptional regulator [Chloroflexota bacterium]|jgi:AcrR family transcriptional regulator|nr:TetR/AcrR family transcriptional regulator [Chloroflexota bacterium]